MPGTSPVKTDSVAGLAKPTIPVPERLQREFDELIRLTGGLNIPALNVPDAVVDYCARLYLAALEYHVNATREYGPAPRYFTAALLHGDGNVPGTPEGKSEQQIAEIYKRGRRARQELRQLAQGPHALAKLGEALKSRAALLPPRARELGEKYLKDADIERFAKTMELEPSLLEPRTFGESPLLLLDLTIFWWSCLIRPLFEKADGQYLMQELALRWKLTASEAASKDEANFVRIMRRALNRPERRIFRSKPVRKRTTMPAPPLWATPPFWFPGIAFDSPPPGATPKS